MSHAPTFADRVLTFNAGLRFDAPLPPGIRVMNPFAENGCATRASEAFYRKYYTDNAQRRCILGINPGRFGAGITGVPFTDPKRLAEQCGIVVPGCPPAHEPSSVFVYEVIAAMGGPEQFYRQWYINSLCPLGFTRKNTSGRDINYNYYDDPRLEAAALPFIITTLKAQLAFGLRRDVCICFGTGKNAAFMEKLNEQHRFFQRIIALPHPRYIMQYKSREHARYLDAYLTALTGCSVS